MDFLDRVLLLRAEEQTASVVPHAPEHDSWAVRGSGEPNRARRARGRFPCVGCGRGVSVLRRGYCPRCKRRIAEGLPTDLDDYLTNSEYRALASRCPGAFVVGGLPRR